MTFAQPSAPNMGDKFEAHEHKGSLLLVYPKRFEENVKTTKGLSDATDCDIIVVDKIGPDGRPLAFVNARLFGNLARSVRNDLGGQVLGRLNQITSASGNTPWIMENFSDQDAAAAGPVHAAYQQGMFQPTPQAAPASVATPPAAQQAPPTAQQWQQQAAPAAQWNGGSPATAAPSAVPPAPVAAQQWAPQQQWQAPPAAAAAAPMPQAAPAPAPAAAVDPNLVAALQSRGVTVTPDMNQQQCETIWASFQ